MSVQGVCSKCQKSYRMDNHALNCLQAADGLADAAKEYLSANRGDPLADKPAEALAAYELLRNKKEVV